MTINMKTFKPTPSPDAKACRELLKDLKPVNEWRKGYVFLCFSYFLIPVITIFYILFPMAKSGFLPDPWGGYVGGGIFLLSALVFIWKLGIELNLALYNHFNIFKKAINPLLDEGEEVLTMVRGRCFDINLPRWFDPNVAEDSYFFFTTDRLLVVCLQKGLAYKFSAHTKTVAQLVKETQFEGMIQEVYTVSLLEPKVNPNSFGWNVLMLNHDEFKLTPVYQTEPYTWLLAKKGTRHGRLINTILERLERGSEGFKF